MCQISFSSAREENHLPSVSHSLRRHQKNMHREMNDLCIDLKCKANLKRNPRTGTACPRLPSAPRGGSRPESTSKPPKPAKVPPAFPLAAQRSRPNGAEGDAAGRPGSSSAGAASCRFSETRCRDRDPPKRRKKFGRGSGRTEKQSCQVGSCRTLGAKVVRAGAKPSDRRSPATLTGPHRTRPCSFVTLGYRAGAAAAVSKEAADRQRRSEPVARKRDLGTAEGGNLRSERRVPRHRGEAVPGLRRHATVRGAHGARGIEIFRPTERLGGQPGRFRRYRVFREGYLTGQKGTGTREEGSLPLYFLSRLRWAASPGGARYGFWGTKAERPCYTELGGGENPFLGSDAVLFFNPGGRGGRRGPKRRTTLYRIFQTGSGLRGPAAVRILNRGERA
ncbi:MAG: hypothetical protein BJ554DRAFT_2839 [Olpidium bornovanus]|uniref:Uncharacterized protein n=1 Tax=Olpidium bornovanus TaxID=278681 RepID=A0A8H8A0T0_9FUNG|nr:MAG: hypothetical protein BJ554DRAFT_2839 [Olpidium bornovanus]